MSPPIKQLEKQNFDIKLECLLPATLTYRILAETPEEALQLIRNIQPLNVKYRLAGKKNIKATIYKAGQNIILYTLNMIGVQW